MPSSYHIFLVAGEASGDRHAAHLVEALRAQNPSLQFSGVGGPQMQGAGVHLYEDLTKIAVVGFVEVLKHFFEFRRVFQLILQKVRATKPDAVILVDYPGFNLRLAPRLKELGVKVIYYISPQVWAWKEDRVEIIKRCVDRMLVLFEFEKEFYAQRGVDVEFVGHPFLDSIQIHQSKEEFLAALGLDAKKLTVGLLPGSRQREVEQLLPILGEAAQLLEKEFKNIQFLLIQAPTIPSDSLKKFLGLDSLPLKIVNGETYDGLNACDVCLVASGTATFETAILNKPMVVVYKTSWLTYFLARRFIKIPYIAMANVVAGKKIVPECIQAEATGRRLAQELKNIFTSERRMAEMKSELQKVKGALGEKGAARRAAEAVLKMLSHR